MRHVNIKHKKDQPPSFFLTVFEPLLFALLFAAGEVFITLMSGRGLETPPGDESPLSVWMLVYH